MSLIREKPGVAIAVVIVCLIVAGYITFGRGVSGPDPSTQRWFYDLETGEMVMHPAGMENLPPITLENGHEAVYAHVFTCGECEQNDMREVGYIEKFTEAGKQQALNPGEEVENFSPDMGVSPGSEQMVAFPGDDPQWVGMNTPMGIQLMKQARRALCPNGNATECYPGQ